jgi:tRNA(Ile)-lysidine synthase
MASSRKRLPSDLLDRVRGELERHVAPGQRLTLALSGGMDSIVLLDILAKLAPVHAFALDCLHVNHGISPNAPAWARFARAVARRYGIGCSVKRADLAPYRGHGLEGAARTARYAFFARARADYVVLAQHQDDQAETVLLQLVRGAGSGGLAAMPTVRAQQWLTAPKLLRPLLGISRHDIHAYARERELNWMEDESNTDERLARNFVRHRVVPVLRELNPQASANLARSAAHLAEAHELIKDLGAMDATNALRNGRMSVASLGALSRARAKNALRWHLAAAGLGPLDSVQTEEILDQLLGARVDADIRIHVGDFEVRRYQGEVWIVARRPTPRRDFEARWRGERAWRLGELGGVMQFRRAKGDGLSRRALAAGPVEVRLRRGGERLQPDPKRPRRSLKALLQEAKIPPWERESVPLLFCGRKLAFVPGIGIDVTMQARPGEPGDIVAWQPVRARFFRRARQKRG